MALYKLLLVDDEEEVRGAIVRKLDWAALGFEVAGEAANGEEALEMAQVLLPDVVMTDIKMPFMDGLTLCRRLRQVLPGVKAAIFSGFDEFEYAKEAISLEVEEYILKPIDAGELAAVFRRLRASLDGEIAERRDVQRLRQYYEESLPLMRQQLLAELLEGVLPQARMEERLAAYGMDLAAPCYCVAVLRPGDADAKDGSYEAAHLLSVSLQRLAEDQLHDAFALRMIPTAEGIALLLLLDGPADLGAVVARLDVLFPLVKKLLGIGLSIGVGSPCEKLADVPRSYREAKNALEYQIIMEPGHCIWIGDIEPAAGEVFWDNAYPDEIVRQIKIGRQEDLEDAVNGLVSHMRKGQMSLQQFQILMLEIATELLKLVRSYKLDVGVAELAGLLPDRAGDTFANLEEMGGFLLAQCEALRRTIRRERKDSTRSLVERARSYLQENYAVSDLSLDMLCGALGVSTAYFSTVFKKEMGQNFVAYLTQLRMERAAEYLAATDDKTYIVAERVGYQDPNYFSYVFKRQFGISPTKYRTDRMAADEAKNGSAG